LEKDQNEALLWEKNWSHYFGKKLAILDRFNNNGVVVVESSCTKK
jgi:hypothetical protein